MENKGGPEKGWWENILGVPVADLGRKETYREMTTEL